MNNRDWQEQAKWFLKSELVRRGINNDELVDLLNDIGISETKTSIDSKISRGTFSAAFLLQCLNAIGCKNFNTEVQSTTINSIAAEPQAVYKIKKKV